MRGAEKITAAFALGLCVSVACTLLAQIKSQWVSVGKDGRLEYASDGRGNRIMDFSHAGYKGGGVALPTVRVVRTLKPIAGDNTAQIQAATSTVSPAMRSVVMSVPVPMSDSIDAAFLNPPGPTVVKYTFTGRIEQVGLEALRVTAPPQDKPISESQYTLLRMNAVADAWVRDVVAIDTHNSTTFASTVRRVTVDNVHVRHTVPFTAPAAPADFAISGTQILLNRSSVSGQGVWPVVTQAGVTGPNVVLNFTSDGAGVAPHQRWATGLLVDSSTFTGGTEQRPNIAFSNREYAGSGHGWSVGWAVAWNVKADYLLIQQPPGARNWCIGCTGRPATILWNGNRVPAPKIPSDVFESPGAQVSPDSLYLAQLRDRLGPSASLDASCG